MRVVDDGTVVHHYHILQVSAGSYKPYISCAAVADVNPVVHYKQPL